MGSSSYRGLIMVPGQEEKRDNLRFVFFFLFFFFFFFVRAILREVWIHKRLTHFVITDFVSDEGTTQGKNLLQLRAFSFTLRVNPFSRVFVLCKMLKGKTHHENIPI